MGWGHILFGFSGRINRAKWWLSVLISVVLYLVAFGVSWIFPSEDLAIPVLLLSVLIVIVLLWITLAAGAKRLHDLNRSGAWLVVFVGVPILLIIIFFAAAGVAAGTAIMAGQTPSEADLMRIGGIAAILGLIYLALVIWALVWFGCLRGTVGPNQYGPDSLEGRL